MASKKVYITLIVILFIFFIVMFLLFGIENIRQDQYSSTIIVGDTAVWKYQDRNWLNIRTKETLDELSWQKYIVFQDNKKLGEYNLWNSNRKWYAFDDKNNAVPINGNMLAYKANFDIDVKDFEEDYIEKDDYVNKVLEDHDISLSSSLTTLYKTKIDFDSDQIDEEFYVLSNVFQMEEANPEKQFSIAFFVKEGNINYLYEDVTSYSQSYNGCKPYYNSFLDVNNDGIYEVILSCGKFSATEQNDMLYQYIDNQFKIVISNQ